MNSPQPITWARWATPGSGPEFRYSAPRWLRLSDLIRRLRTRRTDGHEQGGD